MLDRSASAFCCEFGAVAGSEMREKRREVDLDRSFGDIEFAGDFLVRQAPADASQNIPLSRRDRFYRKAITWHLRTQQ